jgi:putative lipoic acid-binding regulatory protein
MSEEQSLLEFPCRFAIKVMGRTSPELDVLVVEIVRRHSPDLREGAVTSRPSKGGNYTAITVTIDASSREQLDAIYQDLTASPHILMAL